MMSMECTRETGNGRRTVVSNTHTAIQMCASVPIFGMKLCKAAADEDRDNDLPQGKRAMDGRDGQM